MTISKFGTPGSSERRSRFRTKRISLKLHQLGAYYGFEESDGEHLEEKVDVSNTSATPSNKSMDFSTQLSQQEEDLANTTLKNRNSDQTTFVAPSFRVSLPVSEFQSPCSEETLFDDQTEHMNNTLTNTIKQYNRLSINRAVQTSPLENDNWEDVLDASRRISKGATMPRKSTERSPLVGQFKEEWADTTLQNRNSDQLTFVPPSFRVSLPVSHFQSTCGEVISFDDSKEQFNQDNITTKDIKKIDTTEAPEFDHLKRGLPDTTMKNKDQITFVAPSFRASLPVTDFQSTYEDISLDNLKEFSNIVNVTENKKASISTEGPHQLKQDKTDKNRSSNQTTFVAPPFHLSLPVSEFQSSCNENTSLEDTYEHCNTNNITDRNTKRGRPSALQKVAAELNHFQPEKMFSFSQISRMSINRAVQTSPLEGDNWEDVLDMSRRASLYNAIRHKVHIPDEVTTLQNNEFSATKSSFVDSTFEEESSPMHAFPKYQDISEATPPLASKPYLTESNEDILYDESPIENDPPSSQNDATTFLADPPLKSALKKRNRESNSPNSKPTGGLREILLNYVTPTFAPRRKSVYFSQENNATFMYLEDKHVSDNETRGNIQEAQLNEAMDLSLAEAVENIRLGDNSINNVSKNRSSLMPGESLVDSIVVADPNETNMNESIVFGWQNKDKEAEKQKDSANNKNEATAPKQALQFANSSMWDAGGIDDPSFNNYTVQFNDAEDSILDDSIPLTQQSRRPPEWPTLVDNSLGMSNSPSFSNESDTRFEQDDLENVFASQMDSTILYGSQLESDDSLNSPKIKHIVIRANTKKKSPKYVLPAPKIMHNNPDSPSVVESGLRRSARNRIQRCNPGFLQKPIYERDAEGNMTLIGANEVVVHDKDLKKYGVADKVEAFQKEREMKHRKMLENQKKKEIKLQLAQKMSKERN